MRYLNDEYERLMQAGYVRPKIEVTLSRKPCIVVQVWAESGDETIANSKHIQCGSEVEETLRGIVDQFIKRVNPKITGEP